MTDFFKHGNKVYSENLNDGILVGNSFDWTVNMSLPGDTGGVFPNTTTVVKAKVADVSATPNSNLSIGETITNNAGSSQVYRLTVYPNFNRFGGFTFVSLEGDGDVIITEVGASAPIRNNLDYSNLGDVVELKQLKEYDLVVTIPSGGVVTGLGFGFKSSSADVTASINQSNVAGLTDTLSSLESNLTSNLTTKINGKVDKVTGKGLSTNDFTDTHKHGLEFLMNAIVIEEVSFTTKQLPQSQFMVGSYSNQRVGSAILENKLLLQRFNLSAGGSILLYVWGTDMEEVDLPASLKDIVRNKQSQISYSNSNLILELINNNTKLQIRNTGTTAISNGSISYNEE